MSLRPDQRIAEARLELKASLAHRHGIAYVIALHERREKGLRLGEFGELSGRREALDRRREHRVGIGVAISAAVKLRQSQRGAQFEAARLLRLGDSDRGLQGLLGRRGIGRVALEQDSGADAVQFRFIRTVLSGPQLGERGIQAPEPAVSLAGARRAEGH